MNGLALRTEMRRKIMTLQEAMLALPKDQHIEFPLKHHFAPSIYGREITLPKGSAIVGKLHKHAHMNNISKGHVRVVTEFGSYELVAPCSFVSEPGTKRVVVALEETIWTTYHPNPTDTQDLAVIEDYVIAKGYDELGFEENTCLGES